LSSRYSHEEKGSDKGAVSGISLDSGEDLLFSVPLEHVTKRSEIRVPFQIAAESRTTKGGTEHFAFFMGQFMPDEERKE
jgi:hypothetical protein